MLKSEEFEVEVGHILPAAALRVRLHSLPEVRRAIAVLNQGALSENGIRRFVATLMAEFRPGQRFPYDLGLAALAVVLERRPTEFADEYLRHLARLKLAEMPVSIRVARECLKHRAESVPRNQYKRDEYASATESLNAAEEFKVQPFPDRINPTRRAAIPWREYDGVKAC
jgi:hypothetical protein